MVPKILIKNMRLTSLLLLTTLLLLNAGCAHKRLVNAGNDYLDQGQYQNAVEKYQAALSKEPKNKKTQQKLQQANIYFERWLDKLEVAAEVAEQDNNTAKAQLLYAKLAKHRTNAIYRNKALMLQKKNNTKHGLSLFLDIEQPELNSNFSAVLSPITFLQQKPRTSELTENKKILSFYLGNSTFNTSKHYKDVSEEYVSHQETITNPEYEDIQHHIDDLRYQIKEDKYAVNDSMRIVTSQEKDLLLIEKDLEISLLQLERLAKNSNQYRALLSKINTLRSKLTNQQSRLSASQRKLSKLQQNFNHNNAELDDLFHILKDTPRLATVDVIDDYVYSVLTTKQTASAQLLKKSFDSANKQTSREHTILISSQDESHSAHKLIALNEDPLELKSRSALTQQLYKATRKKVIELIKEEALLYQSTLLNQAKVATSTAQQFEYQLLAAIVTGKLMPNSDRSQLVQRLTSEFGVAGNFELEELLVK